MGVFKLLKKSKHNAYIFVILIYDQRLNEQFDGVTENIAWQISFYHSEWISTVSNSMLNVRLNWQKKLASVLNLPIFKAIDLD